MDDLDKLKLCVGCTDNFYNGNNSMGVTRCWLLDRANVVTRYRIGWWTPQESAKNYTEVRTLHCHREPGRYAYVDRLPEHLR